MSENLLKKQTSLQAVKLERTSRLFRSHPSHTIVPLGVMKVEEKYGDSFANLDLFVLSGDGLPII